MKTKFYKKTKHYYRVSPTGNAEQVTAFRTRFGIIHDDKRVFDLPSFEDDEDSENKKKVMLKLGIEEITEVQYDRIRKLVLAKILLS